MNPLRQRLNHMIDEAFWTTWQLVDHFIRENGRLVLFFSHSIRQYFIPPARLSETVRQIEFIANKSVFIIGLTGLFTGMAMSYQVYLGFKLVNAVNLVGPTVAMGITRELGPVLTGLIVAARAGGAMAARLGTMRVTEQIDALEVIGVDPKQYLVAPRIIAAVMSMPLLTTVFDFISVAGSYILCIRLLGLDEAVFFERISEWMEPRHIYEGLFKSAAFGLIFATVCCYSGYHTQGGAKGVGESTNMGVVNSMVLIIIMNYFLTNVIRIYYQILGI